MNKPNLPVKSADRVLDVLEFIAPKFRAVSHAEIARCLDIPKSSLSQLLNTLVQRGYLSLDAHSRGYLIGDAFNAITEASQHDSRLLEMARPLLEAATAKVNETTSLAVIRNMEIEVIDRIDSTQALTFNLTVGGRAPLYSMSTGKAILAHLPNDELTRYLQGITFEPLTDKTLKSTRALKDQLRRARAEGVAYSMEEFALGVCAISAPVLDDTGYPIAAVNFVIPSVRMTDELRNRCAKLLISAAKKIRTKL